MCKFKATWYRKPSLAALGRQAGSTLRWYIEDPKKQYRAWLEARGRLELTETAVAAETKERAEDVDNARRWVTDAEKALTDFKAANKGAYVPKRLRDSVTWARDSLRRAKSNLADTDDIRRTAQNQLFEAFLSRQRTVMETPVLSTEGA